MNPPSRPIGAVVVDANVTIALASHEATRVGLAAGEIARYTGQGYKLYAPGAIITETIFILCGKLGGGILTPADYAAAVAAFERTMQTILPPPNGDRSLIQRAEQIRTGYGCSRSADSFYIALAEELSQIMPTVLLTFDQDLPKQAAKNAPSVVVKLL